jgi:hypothetical protein
MSETLLKIAPTNKCEKGTQNLHQMSEYELFSRVLLWIRVYIRLPLRHLYEKVGAMLFAVMSVVLMSSIPGQFLLAKTNLKTP